MGAAENGIHTGSIDRRRLLKTAGVATAAAGSMWIAPSVLGSSTAFAVGSPNCACTGTATAQVLTGVADSTPDPLPTASNPAPGASSGTVLCFCRANAWTTRLPLGDGPRRNRHEWSDVRRHRSGHRHREAHRGRERDALREHLPVPELQSDRRRRNTHHYVGTGTYDPAVQRVYTSTGSNIWDYLPPQPANSPETATPTTWWNASQPAAAGNTQSLGNPGYNHAAGTAPNLGSADTPWPGPIDISYLFGTNCGQFDVTVEDWNRYQQYKWSNIFVGTTHP